MLITAVGTPGSGQTHAFRVRHGMNPHVELWRHGLVVREYLSADRVDDEIVVTAHVAPRTSSSQPPRTRKSVPDLSEDRQADEPVRPYQRIAAYAVVRSRRGLLGTECSPRTAVPGLWALPGGGLEPGESPRKRSPVRSWKSPDSVSALTASSICSPIIGSAVPHRGARGLPCPADHLLSHQRKPHRPLRHRRRWHHPVSPVDTAVALASAVLGSRDTHVS